MKKISTLILLGLFCGVTAKAQQFAGQNPPRRYIQAEILDSTDGITMYTRLVSALGGDSVTYNRAGYNLQGWNEDFYTSGKLLHRGYYVDGRLITFKNFFESGQCERAVENPDPVHCTVDIFFENGSPRRQIHYYNGRPQQSYEFYESGLPKYAEENEKEMNYLTLKKAWYTNGILESSLELVDRRNKKYSQKKYYANGQMKEEGTIILLSGTHDYVKDGTWYCYDSDGKNRRIEKHSHGIKLNSNQ